MTELLCVFFPVCQVSSSVHFRSQLRFGTSSGLSGADA